MGAVDVEDDEIVVVAELEADALLVDVELGADKDDDEDDDDEAEDDIDEAEDEVVDEGVEDDEVDDDEVTDELVEESLDVLAIELDRSPEVVLEVVDGGAFELLPLELEELIVADAASDDDVVVLLDKLINGELEVMAVLKEIMLDDWLDVWIVEVEIPLLDDRMVALYLYKLKPLGPPQYSSLSAEHSILQRPSVAGLESELTTFEQ